jgi:penicillin-binding protein 2
MVTLTAAMNNGLMNLDTKVKDEGVWTRLENFYPKCLLYSSVYATHGEIECKFALEVSCNYFFYELGHWLTIEQLDETAKGFGLGEPTGVELPEITGHRSNRESKAAEYTGLSAQWFPGDRILTAIGQAENRFTPMQLCVYACTLANRGTRYKATFLNRVVSPDYRTLIRENQPEILSHMDICQDAYLGYMGGMRQVITGSAGTARKYFDGHGDSFYDYNGLWPYKDVVVYAKTGTAETFKNVSDNGSFICFAGYEGQDPEIAVAIYGEKVAHGSTMAKVAEEIIRAYFAKVTASEVPTYENQLS